MADAIRYSEYIRHESLSPGSATKWLDSLEALIRSLAEMPVRFRLIEEQELFDIPIRQVIHYSHRVIYTVNEETQTVHVLRIYHGARSALLATDVNMPTA